MYRHIDINRKLQYFLVDFSDLTASENLFFRIFLIQTITFADFLFFCRFTKLKKCIILLFRSAMNLSGLVKSAGEI